MEDTTDLEGQTVEVKEVSKDLDGNDVAIVLETESGEEIAVLAALDYSGYETDSQLLITNNR